MFTARELLEEIDEIRTEHLERWNTYHNNLKEFIHDIESDVLKAYASTRYIDRKEEEDILHQTAEDMIKSGYMDYKEAWIWCYKETEKIPHLCNPAIQLQNAQQDFIFYKYLEDLYHEKGVFSHSLDHMMSSLSYSNILLRSWGAELDYKNYVKIFGNRKEERLSGIRRLDILKSLMTAASLLHDFGRRKHHNDMTHHKNRKHILANILKEAHFTQQEQKIITEVATRDAHRRKDISSLTAFIHYFVCSADACDIGGERSFLILGEKYPRKVITKKDILATSERWRNSVKELSRFENIPHVLSVFDDVKAKREACAVVLQECNIDSIYRDILPLIALKEIVIFLLLTSNLIRPCKEGGIEINWAENHTIGDILSLKNIPASPILTIYKERYYPQKFHITEGQHLLDEFFNLNTCPPRSEKSKYKWVPKTTIRFLPKDWKDLSIGELTIKTNGIINSLRQENHIDLTIRLFDNENRMRLEKLIKSSYRNHVKGLFGTPIRKTWKKKVSSWGIPWYKEGNTIKEYEKWFEDWPEGRCPSSKEFLC